MSSADYGVRLSPRSRLLFSHFIFPLISDTTAAATEQIPPWRPIGQHLHDPLVRGVLATLSDDDADPGADLDVPASSNRNNHLRKESESTSLDEDSDLIRSDEIDLTFNVLLHQIRIRHNPERTTQA